MLESSLACCSTGNRTMRPIPLLACRMLRCGVPITTPVPSRSRRFSDRRTVAHPQGNRSYRHSKPELLNSWEMAPRYPSSAPSMPRSAPLAPLLACLSSGPPGLNKFSYPRRLKRRSFYGEADSRQARSITHCSFAESWKVGRPDRGLRLLDAPIKLTISTHRNSRTVREAAP